MFKKLDEVEKKYKTLHDRMADPVLHANLAELQKLAREEAALRSVVETYRIYKGKKKDLEDNKKMLAEEKDAGLK